MLTAELVLTGCILIQVLLLLLHSRPVDTSGFISWLAQAGFLAAAVISVGWGQQEAASGLTWNYLIEDQPLLRLPRAALFLVAILLVRTFVSTREVPASRKPVVIFLLSVIVLLCDFLILSRHTLLSVILLVFINWIGVFLAGLAFRGRLEGEAVLKHWFQGTLSLSLGFGCVLFLALIAGGVSFSVIAQYLQNQPLYSAPALFTILALCLPYFLVGGLFPFHFVNIDRDQGLPWGVQLTLSVLVQGAVTLAVWKMGVEVFAAARPGVIAEGMRVLQVAGLAGGFWLVLFSLSQTNSKRLFSALLGAQWSAILAAGAYPSPLGMSAVVYAFSSAFLWSSMLGFIWSRLQESSGGDLLSDVHGSARYYRASGILLLFALAGPLCVPGLAGLPSVLHLLAAMIEQKSVVFLLAEGALLALICLSCWRIATDFLFRSKPEAVSPPGHVRYGALDAGAMALLGAALLVLGFLWHPVFSSMNQAAKAFL